MADVSPAQIQESLGGIDFPARKQELIDHARKGGNENDRIMEIINQLPEKDYNSPVDVTKEEGKIE